MDDGANRRLCDAMSRRGFTPKAKVSTVVILGAGTGNNYDETCRNVIFAPTESWVYTSNQPEVKKFRDAYARYQPGLPVARGEELGIFHLGSTVIGPGVIRSRTRRCGARCGVDTGSTCARGSGGTPSRMMSASLIRPTSRPCSTTGRAVTRCSDNRCAASGTVASGPIVTTSRVISSRTSMGDSSSADPGRCVVVRALVVRGQAAEPPVHPGVVHAVEADLLSTVDDVAAELLAVAGWCRGGTGDGDDEQATGQYGQRPRSEIASHHDPAPSFESGGASSGGRRRPVAAAEQFVEDEGAELDGPQP
jgi:hypothetical protein